MTIKEGLEKTKVELPKMLEEIKQQLEKEQYDDAAESTGILLANIGSVLGLKHFAEEGE